jgi:glycosyltransferase involved in cell wall biosynthesis
MDAAQPSYRKLSVLMPVYNEIHTLRTIIGRVLAAPVGLEIELVAVDDGSTDGSRELLRDLAARDGRIRPIFHERNRGKGAALRTAIARSSTAWRMPSSARASSPPNAAGCSISGRRSQTSF